MNRTRPLVAAVLVAALVPGLAGCFSGSNAQTQAQASMNAGNGTQARIGDIRVESATLVRGPEGSRAATLVMTLVSTAEGDKLMAVDVAGKPAFITGQTAEVPARGSVAFGYNSELWINVYDFEAPASSFVTVKVTMERSGIREMSVITVPPVGYYEGIAPNPATAPLT